ncbi:MAG: hypothetical protein QNI87_00415 [Erythrobacter sp.]|uniref:hypothetical protein n=1 Tax=Erythrobacter sp. TaxID=1042 RepID=UPI00261B7280|nr:hypothetical protein [Erythrobacter sp.]MDJ0976979.1 hypothetical protein [Erythrobacter sp.]
MLRGLIILTLAIVLGAGAYFVLRDDGVLEQVTAERVEQALLDNRVPEPMAACMGPRLADRLSIGQLRALERAKPQAGESTLPLSTGEAMARLRRIDDREAVEQVVIVAGGCGFDLMMQGF